jgi:tetratricopeptide (TPR) repeat protein
MKQLFKRPTGLVAAAVLAISGSCLLGAVGEAKAQTILEEQGTIEPAEQEYTLDISEGDVLAIIVTSEDFDTVVSLVAPDGEEVAFNDDFGGTLNSRIVYTATASGNYTIVAKSFDGQGGDYSLEVRPASEYEVAYSDAEMSIQEQDYEGAIAAYSDAISLAPEDPEAYLGRADAYFGQAQAELEAEGMFLEDPSDLSPDIRDAIIADFEMAAELYEAEGDSFTAQSLREQIQYIRTGESPDAIDDGTDGEM